MAENELDHLDPDPITVKLSNGSAVDLVRLETLQLFALLKILTHGGLGNGLLSSLDFSLPPDEFTTRLITMLVLSIPDAGLEAMEFIRLMAEPHGLAKGRKLSKKDTEDNQARWAAMNDYLRNPPIEDTMDIIIAIIEQEAPHFQSLGNKLGRTLSVFSRTGQDKQTGPAKPAAVQAEAASAAASKASP
jgi:hypothetical protein